MSVPRPDPPPRSARKCKHGTMEMSWIKDPRFRAGGYWNLFCRECADESIARFGSAAVL